MEIVRSKLSTRIGGILWQHQPTTSSKLLVTGAELTSTKTLIDQHLSPLNQGPARNSQPRRMSYKGMKRRRGRRKSSVNAKWVLTKFRLVIYIISHHSSSKIFSTDGNERA